MIENKVLKSFSLIKDKDEMIILFGYIEEVIPNGEVRTITSFTNYDLRDAKCVEYTINK